MSLVELRIHDFAVFADATIPFGEGFTALTGETGAGKSLCVTALRLALGDRLDGDPIRSRTGTTRLTAVFDEASPALNRRLIDIGVPADELTTLTRELPPAGRGSCRINGALVSLALLREVGESLAEVTVQGASHRLLQRGRQRDILDLASGTAELRDEVRQAVGDWRRAQERAEEVRRLRAAGAAELGEAARLVEEVGPLALRPGEEEGLAAERLRLRNAVALTAASGGFWRAACGDDDTSGAADVLASALDASAALVGLDPALDALSAEATDLVDRLRDLGGAARRHADSIALDAARLAEVEERLDVLARVRRRHGSIEMAVQAVEAAAELLAAGADEGGRVAAAEAAVLSARGRAGELALRLSERRRHGARRLEVEVERGLHLLELPRARLRVVLERRADPDGVDAGGATVRCGPWGVDEVEMRLAVNGGDAPVALDQGPSGGELSRLVLALSACVTESGSPLLVLDEVDAGIGGETAARVGDLLAATGRSRQVVAVTHRAEIASRAPDHVVVRKLDTAAGVVARVDRLDGDDRLAEIARLMSGRVTGAALARALELRGEAVETAAVGTSRPGRRRRRPA